MAEVLSVVSTVSYILAVIFSICSVILWFKFKILRVIGDLSGRTAKNSITRTREMNEKRGANFYSAKPGFNKDMGFQIKEENKKKENDAGTGLLNENRENSISISAQTGLLAGETMEMEIADTDETTELETVRVRNNDRQGSVTEEIDFELIEEIILVHTDEVAV